MTIFAASRDAPTMYRREASCITHGAKRYVYICSHKGCNNIAVKGGVCITHGAITAATAMFGLESINSNNNPTLQPNAFTFAILSHHAVDYKDEEEHNYVDLEVKS
jgi:hypothetical protein